MTSIVLIVVIISHFLILLIIVLQEDVHYDVMVERPSLFHVIFRYVSREATTITAHVTATPEQPDGLEQSSTVSFRTTYDPLYVTVSGSPFVLDPGRWTFTLSTDENVFVVSMRIFKYIFIY